MGHDQQRAWMIGIRLLDDSRNVRCRGTVESGGGFVVEHNLRPIRQNAGNSQPLPLTTAQGGSAHVGRHSQFIEQSFGRQPRIRLACAEP